MQSPDPIFTSLLALVHVPTFFSSTAHAGACTDEFSDVKDLNEIQTGHPNGKCQIDARKMENFAILDH